MHQAISRAPEYCQRESDNCSGNRFAWALHGSLAVAQLGIDEGLDVRGELRSLFSPNSRLELADVHQALDLDAARHHIDTT